MLDDIIEIILEIVFGIFGEVLMDVEIPKPVRIGLGVIALALAFGLCGILIGMGIRDANVLLIAAGIGLLVLFVGVTMYLVRKHRREKNI